MSGRIYIGIDNGIHGGIATLDENGIGSVLKMPLEPCGKRVDGLTVYALLKSCVPPDSVVAIELLPDHMDSAQTMRSFAMNYGILYAAAKLSGLRVVEVPCGNRLDGWQRRLLGRQAKGGNKAAAAALARKLWPDYPFPTVRPKGKVLHDGVVDAALIAYDTQLQDRKQP
jgi:hypothetical protein